MLEPPEHREPHEHREHREHWSSGCSPSLQEWVLWSEAPGALSALRALRAETGFLMPLLGHDLSFSFAYRWQICKSKIWRRGISHGHR
jgi:hypothetical protein